jgi:dihydrofolate reductase
VGGRHRELGGPNRARRTRGLDDYFTRDFARNIGAEIMGRNKFGPQRGPWENLDWKGWWGDTPPFHTPVFVLTHHHRPSFTLADTTFHFLDAAPAEALRQAKDAAEGKDVRVGGGVATVRQFLEADLIDTIHVAGRRWDPAIAAGGRISQPPIAA